MTSAISKETSNFEGILSRALLCCVAFNCCWVAPAILVIVVRFPVMNERPGVAVAALCASFGLGSFLYFQSGQRREGRSMPGVAAMAAGAIIGLYAYAWTFNLLLWTLKHKLGLFVS